MWVQTHTFKVHGNRQVCAFFDANDQTINLFFKAIFQDNCHVLMFICYVNPLINVYVIVCVINDNMANETCKASST